MVNVFAFNGSSPSIRIEGGNGGAGGGGDDGMYASIKCWGCDGNCTKREGTRCWSLVDDVENSFVDNVGE